MPENFKFSDGDTIILRSTREAGRIEGNPTLDGGERWYRVRFTKRVDNIVEEELDPLGNTEQTVEQLTKDGCWGSIQSFRTALAVERITHENRSTVYSFNSQRVLFEPYQYKPLLKTLDSPDRRLLIADEVGLGKTIEVCLILTEFQARRKLDKVLIACPSRLRDKWREELNRKFDQDFDIYSKNDLLGYIDRFLQNPARSQLRAIVSMQTLRNKDIRDRLLADLGHIDMVIVDEAHHARNPSSQTSKMLQDLCEVGDYAFLLTATPLHLKNRDLFTLLKALRPAFFIDENYFDHQLSNYAGVHKASRYVRTQRADNLQLVKEILESMFVDDVPLDKQNPLAIQVIKDIDASPPECLRDWIDLERRVQDLHPLSTIITRTRKRDVIKDAPERRAKVIECQLTQGEMDLYRWLVEGSTGSGWNTRPLSLGQIQKARQAASSLPAAAQSAIDTARTDDDSNELTDILPSEITNATDEKAGIIREPHPESWTGEDSKYDKLREILNMVWQEEDNVKILIFTFFRGTASYLESRLVKEGIPCVRIAGDVPSRPRQPDRDERGKCMQQFKDDPSILVMVSTEVGSEGLDFQFCHHLVNYDLPWNPMVVEQRIGRIDRYGQKSKFVQVHNLVIHGTVEERILCRLYDRIGIFKESIGDIETILGETISELQNDYINGNLTSAEAENRVTQAARAINARRRDQEELENNAGELFGHEEFIRDEMQRVERLGRFISKKSILAVIETFLGKYHPGIQLWEEKEGSGIYGLRITDALRREIYNTPSGGATWNDRSKEGRLFITTDGNIGFQRSDIELINSSHPLLRAAVDKIEEQLHSPNSRVAKAVLLIEEQGDLELLEGLYFLFVFVHTIDGIRARRVLETIVWFQHEDTIIEEENGERLLHLVLEGGEEWNIDNETPAVPENVWKKINSEARRRNQRLRKSEGQENAALYIQRKNALEAEFKHSLSAKEKRFKTSESRGHTRILPALKGQIDKAKSEYQKKVEELENTKDVSIRLSGEPVAVCVINAVHGS